MEGKWFIMKCTTDTMKFAPPPTFLGKIGIKGWAVVLVLTCLRALIYNVYFLLLIVLLFLFLCRLFTERNPLVLGWLAKVPSPDRCPTGHLYLRSPCGEDEFPVYLGGPISLANFDEVNGVICKRLISVNEPNKNKMAVHKAPRRKISGGQEVLWSYNLNVTAKCHPNFYPNTDWQLVSVIYSVHLLLQTLHHGVLLITLHSSSSFIL